jgi:hypothetical protein
MMQNSEEQDREDPAAPQATAADSALAVAMQIDNSHG